MSKFLQRNSFLYVIGLSLSVSLGVVLDATAKPVSTEDCQPVARDVDSRKTYCAHELKALKLQKKSANQSSGILCYLVRRVFPFDALMDLTQCVPKDFGYRLNSDEGRVTPKPKGSSNSLAIHQPLGKTLITSQPDLAWNTVPKAASYRVSLEEGSQWVWSEEIDQANLKFPSSHTLQPNRSYKLSVVAFDQDDQMIDKEVKYLKLVDPKTLTEIDNAVSASRENFSNPLVRGVDRAMMLYHAGLVDAAVTQLESLTKFQEPVVYLQLGLIYKQAGRTEIAQSYLKKASELVNRKIRPVSRQETKAEPRRN